MSILRLQRIQINPSLKYRKAQYVRRCDAASTKDMEQSVYHLTPFSRFVA